MKLIEPVAVERDTDGFWSHPEIPDFDEDAVAMKAWCDAQGLEFWHAELENEDDDHPAYVSYFDNESASVAEWNPEGPMGADWFTFSIHDTEDGPMWYWARRTSSKGSTDE